MTCGIRPIGGGSIGSGSGVRGQVVIPVADLQQGAWTSMLSGGLFDAVSIDSIDELRVIESGENPDDDVFELRFEPISDPGVDFDHRLIYRFRKDGARRVDFTAELLQGSTVIASYLHLDISSSFTLAEQTLTDAEASAITNYADLRFRGTAKAQ